MKKIFLFCLILLGTTLTTVSVTSAPAEGDMVVIVNKDNPVAALSASEAKLYYLRKLKNRWPGINKNIRPAMRKTKCAERDNFHSKILKMSDTEVETYFAERQFQNAEKTPDKLNSDSEVVEFVEQEVGGIGYINARSATAEVRSRVKVILEF